MRLSSSRKTTEGAKPRRGGGLSIVDANPHRHAVQFYESAEFLVRSVSDYLHAGLKANEPGIIIATPEHRDGIARELTARGVDLASICAWGMLTELDAHNTLQSFMLNGKSSGLCLP